ncbi:hypothetical protein B0H17DRAFT_1148686 [Mycena rosella]|uniref:Uncharacterized protein n=1 Tax=Mycena rosella TaxID=1033263 RepID=A0AAD7C9N0_MYCRO|nr:hypothetical protein B0H17DRAFT_1148686 [Mycena rosella]
MEDFRAQYVLLITSLTGLSCGGKSGVHSENGIPATGNRRHWRHLRSMTDAGNRNLGACFGRPDAGRVDLSVNGTKRYESGTRDEVVVANTVSQATPSESRDSRLEIKKSTCASVILGIFIRDLGGISASDIRTGAMVATGKTRNPELELCISRARDLYSEFVVHSGGQNTRRDSYLATTHSPRVSFRPKVLGRHEQVSELSCASGGVGVCIEKRDLHGEFAPGPLKRDLYCALHKIAQSSERLLRLIPHFTFTSLLAFSILEARRLLLSLPSILHRTFILTPGNMVAVHLLFVATVLAAAVSGHPLVERGPGVKIPVGSLLAASAVPVAKAGKASKASPAASAIAGTKTTAAAAATSASAAPNAAATDAILAAIASVAAAETAVSVASVSASSSASAAFAKNTAALTPGLDAEEEGNLAGNQAKLQLHAQAMLDDNQAIQAITATGTLTPDQQAQLAGLQVQLQLDTQSVLADQGNIAFIQNIPNNIPPSSRRRSL